jgi:hypothetical protein
MEEMARVKSSKLSVEAKEALNAALAYYNQHKLKDEKIKMTDLSKKFGVNRMTLSRIIQSGSIASGPGRPRALTQVQEALLEDQVIKAEERFQPMGNEELIGASVLWQAKQVLSRRVYHLQSTQERT